MNKDLITQITELIKILEVGKFWEIAKLNFETREQFFEYINIAEKTELERILLELNKFFHLVGDLS